MDGSQKQCGHLYAEIYRKFGPPDGIDQGPGRIIGPNPDQFSKVSPGIDIQFFIKNQKLYLDFQ